MTNQSLASRCCAALRIVLASASASGSAPAAGGEIRVYRDQMNRKGGCGLDGHSSYGLGGHKTPGLPGEQAIAGGSIGG